MSTGASFFSLTRVRFCLAAASGALATFAFAPYGFWPAMLVSLLAFLLLLAKQPAKSAAWIGFGWGLGQFGTGVSWVYVVIEKFGGLPLPIGLLLITLLIGYLSLYPALFGYLSQRIQLSDKRYYWLFIPSLWVLVDTLRGILFTGFPWLLPGYSQIDGPFASLAPLLGVQGVTLAIMLFVSSIAYTLLRRDIVATIPLLVLLLASFLASHATWVTPQKSSVDVALVQGNVEQELKWQQEQLWPTLLSYQDLTRKHWDADLIIWPEAAIPTIENDVTDLLTRIDAAARYNNTAVIIGLLNKDPQQRFFNDVITLGTNGEAPYEYPAKQRYSKHQLLVFGEFVPFEEWLRPLAPMFNLPMSSFSPGDYHQSPLQANGYQLTPALCYEIAFNEQVRNNLSADTDFILTLSNDTWFGNSIGPHQHMEIARMRALENGMPLLRSTNTGITAAVDHHGKIIKQLPQFTTEVLRVKVTPTTGETFYRQWGDIPLYVWVMVSLISTVFRKVRNKQQMRAFT
ncbi:MAG: apolipoprotein N-acyltransferase [Vibrionaceae bacterium]